MADDGMVGRTVQDNVGQVMVLIMGSLLCMRNGVGESGVEATRKPERCRRLAVTGLVSGGDGEKNTGSVARWW